MWGSPMVSPTYSDLGIPSWPGSQLLWSLQHELWTELWERDHEGCVRALQCHNQQHIFLHDWKRHCQSHRGYQSDRWVPSHLWYVFIGVIIKCKLKIEFLQQIHYVPGHRKHHWNLDHNSSIPVGIVLRKEKTNTKWRLWHIGQRWPLVFILYALLLPGEHCLGFWGPV